MKEEKGYKSDADLTAEDLKALVAVFKKIYEDNEGRPFPQDPKEQLVEAVKAVFRSWDNPRANVYRKMNEIPYEWGTAVNVQQMAFGNSGDRSGTGVAFTRDPATGAKKLMGEYLINAQGEDVVAGVRTPSPISHLKDQMPEVYEEFVDIANRLEKYFRDMQDMEFTIEDGHLYMLQTRNGKRTAQAALQVACDLVDEGMITEQEAVLRVEPKQLDTLLHPQFDAAALKAAEVVGKGLAASPGSACGQIVFTAEEAEEMVKSGKMKKVVLVRLETSPEDIVGMQVSQGILTVRGGMTSHAAVVAAAWAPAASPAAATTTTSRSTRRPRPSRSTATSSWAATGSPSTAPPATSTPSRSPLWLPPATRTSTASWAGPTLPARCWS